MIGAGALAAVAAALAVLWPDATRNAFARFATPWSDTPRYTFAALEPLPADLVVAHGEPFTVSAKLRIFRAPEFLATAFLLAVLGLLVHLLLGA